MSLADSSYTRFNSSARPRVRSAGRPVAMQIPALLLGLGTVLRLSAPTAASPVLGGYYPSWSSWTSPITAVPLQDYDYVSVFVAVPNTDGSLDMGGLDQANADAVTAIHAAGKRATLTIGGWTGSWCVHKLWPRSLRGSAFTSLWATAASRKTWAKQLAAVLKTLN